jgi:hypothetical protein
MSDLKFGLSLLEPLHLRRRPSRQSNSRQSTPMQKHESRQRKTCWSAFRSGFASVQISALTGCGNVRRALRLRPQRDRERLSGTQVSPRIRSERAPVLGSGTTMRRTEYESNSSWAEFALGRGFVVLCFELYQLYHSLPLSATNFGTSNQLAHFQCDRAFAEGRL